MIELAGLEAADAKIHGDLVAFNVPENDWLEVVGPPDLCCQKLGTAARGLTFGASLISQLEIRATVRVRDLGHGVTT